MIGWSSAQWDIINPLIEEGILPHLHKLKKESSYCSLRSHDPSLITSNWITVNTGCKSTSHGIINRMKVEDGECNPLSSYDVKKKNIFEIAADFGLKSLQISAPLTHPFTHQENVFGVSEYIQYSTEDSICHSLDLEIINSCREISDQKMKEHLSLLIDENNIEKIRDNYHNKFFVIEDFIKDSIIVTKLFEEYSNHIDWSLCGLFYHKLDLVLFQFIEYLPLLNIDPANIEFRFFKNVVKGAFQLLDRLLGRIIETVNSTHTTIYLLSPSGYKPNVNWISEYKKTIRSGEYSEKGFWLLNGENYKSRELHFDANIFDVAPSIAALLEIPQSKDWAHGKIFLEQDKINSDQKELNAYDKNVNQENEYSYPAIIKDVFKRNINMLYDISQDDISEIEELHNYFIARSFISTGNYVESIPLMESLWRMHRYNQWYGARLVGAYISNNRIDKANEIIDEVLQIDERIPELLLIKANLLIHQKKFRSASEYLELAGENKCNISGIFGQIASCYESMNFNKRADKYFKKELVISNHPKDYFGYAHFLMQEKRINPAIENFDKVLEKIPNHALANYFLGMLLFQKGDFERSAELLEIAKSMPPNAQVAQRAHDVLVEIYKNKLKRPDKINEMREAFEKSIGSLGEIIIVSGLPRSGTSMMMQMLMQGGVDIFADGKRTADENNKKGYLEHEAIKNLAKEKGFLIEAKDKAVKVISHLLKHLPHVFSYKIIFMDREIHEVMTSQSKMLRRLGNERDQSEKLLKTFEKSRSEAIQWCKKNKKNVELLLISYNDVLERPIQFSEEVNQFLGNTLDVRAMASVVDKSLYREKFIDGAKNS